MMPAHCALPLLTAYKPFRLTALVSARLGILSLFSLLNISLFTVREKCMGCTQPITTGNKNIICSNCSKLSHFKCSVSSGFETKQTSSLSQPAWFCHDCRSDSSLTQLRFNPFKDLVSSGVQPDDIFSEFLKAGILLDECLTLDNIAHLNRIMKTRNVPNNFSIFFNNIDGNQTNFDTLTIDLDRHDCKFSAITLCETNVDSANKDLFHIHGYESHQ